MEPFSAALVYETGRSFEQLRSTCNLIERFGKVKFSGTEIIPSEMEYIELRSTRTRTDLPEDWQESVVSILTSVEKYCKSIGLKLASQAAEEFLENCSHKPDTYPVMSPFAVSFFCNYRQVS
jgi:hypothetical protein